jgi:peptidoglycan hydrolase-like protein with peptidoglycan-binding domain
MLTSRTLARRALPAVAATVLVTGGALAVPAASASTTTARAGAKPVTAQDTYGSCDYVNDWSRPTKSYGAGLPPKAPDAHVKQIQCLVNVGSKYPRYVTVDGRFGPDTRKAVRWVQSCNHTRGGVDGIVGRWTWLDLYIPDTQCAL